MTRRSILTNVASTLANETSIERGGQVIKGILRQLGYAGIKVSEDELTQALDDVAEHSPSCFGPRPLVSSEHSPWGTEWRLRHPSEIREAARDCTDAVYEVTDTMDRTSRTISCRNRLGNIEHITLETIRPHAFAVAMGHLRVRWAGGNYTRPRPSTIRRWVGIA